jgi:LacI family transcriptional regulator
MIKATKARLVDVAKDAGVSLATVSRAMTQPGLLANETLQRVTVSARKLGYRPHEMARALASGRSMTIGAIVPTLDSAIFAKFLQAMQASLSTRGYRLLVASHEANPEAEFEIARSLLARGVDGLALIGGARPPETNKMLATSGVPVVMAWCGHPAFGSVTVDNHAAGRLVAEHLLALGHRRVGMVVGALRFNDRQQARLQGVRDALAQAGATMSDAMVSQQPLTMAGGRSGCARLLERDHAPTAIIGGVDVLAIGCLQEAQSRGLPVPDKLSIAGIDDIEMSAYLSPSLTTIHIPTSQIGEHSAQWLVQALAEPQKRREVRLPIELVVRRSTGPLR